MTTSHSFTNISCKSIRWKWLLKIIEDKDFNLESVLDKLSKNDILQSYGIIKNQKNLPCHRKCKANPWCLTSLYKESKSQNNNLTDRVRDEDVPIGLQNTANTCWINSAIQALFNIYQFRNCINSIKGFSGEENLNSLEYLLQAMFVEMELHRYKAMACAKESIFEKLAVFVTKEIMQKDKDYEVLKCVSEFLENTIDKLLANPRTGPLFSSIFRTTLYRIAKWSCTSCHKEHIRQLSPDSCYTMAAYVGGDECPLDQCILDLQTETQTGVSLLCEGEDGCGSTVKVDRVVTPQILTLPSLLIIRNNSLLDHELKRRLHVVYSDTLDLTQHTCNNQPATYVLRSVIFHHGHWIKHFSAHVMTEDGRWFNFNDEKVVGLETRTGNSHPLENHKDYFSFPNIANKYKKKPRVRVSRGSFIWIYQKANDGKEISLLPPPQTVQDFVKTKRNKRSENIDAEIIEKLRSDRKKLLKELTVQNCKNDYSIISLPVLSAWYNFDGKKFVPSPSLLAEGMCEHGKFHPFFTDSFKFIEKNKAKELLKAECGIHCEETRVVYSEDDAFCEKCVLRHANLIIFKERVKIMQKIFKKGVSKVEKSGMRIMGSDTATGWSKLALRMYTKERGFEVSIASEEGSSTQASNEINQKDTEVVCNDEVQSESTNERLNETDVEKLNPLNHASKSPSPSKETEEATRSNEQELSLLNEDIVCHHGDINPNPSSVWVPDEIFDRIKDICFGAVHPAMLKEDFSICSKCLNTRNRTLETCQEGKEERRRLNLLLFERKRPNPSKDANKTIYFLSKEFFNNWKAFVRLCFKDDQQICRPLSIKNSSIICKHGQLLYSCSTNKENPLFQFSVLIWEEEWLIFTEFYSYDVAIKAHYDDKSKLIPEIAPCSEGCVEEEATRLHEEQFVYESGCINIKQVNTENDVPTLNRTSTVTENEEALPPKRMRTEFKKNQASTTLRSASQRLVRSSKWFSSSDTIKEVQNFIAERTGIWPLLQSLWLGGSTERNSSPLFLTDEHRSMTLNALRIKPGDTVYFRAAKEDLRRAAGDGETEFSIDLEEDEN